MGRTMCDSLLFVEEKLNNSSPVDERSEYVMLKISFRPTKLSNLIIGTSMVDLSIILVLFKSILNLGPCDTMLIMIVICFFLYALSTVTIPEYTP